MHRAKAPSPRSGEGGLSVRARAQALGLPDALLAAIPDGPEDELPGPAIPAAGPGAPIGTVAELEMLAAGLRPAVLLHGPEPWIAGVCDWARRRSLTAMPSAWAFLPQRDAGLGGYANLAAARVPASGAAGEWRAVAVSASASLAWLLWLAEARGWDRVMGLALGYPPCCIEAFLRDWPQAVTRCAGDLGRMRLGPEGAEMPWELNVFARYAGPVLTEHFPCSWTCVTSLARARRLAGGLARTAPALLAGIEARMRRDIALGPDGWHPGPRHDGDRVRILVPVLQGSS